MMNVLKVLTHSCVLRTLQIYTDEKEDVENVALTLIIHIKCLSLLETVFLSFVEQVCFGTSQIYNFWATITLKRDLNVKSTITRGPKVTYIFFLNRTLFAIIGVRNSGSSANYTSALVRAVITFITNPDKSTWTHIGITNNTFSITLFT